MESSKIFLVYVLLFTIQVVYVTCTQFQVGGKSTNGWEVPKSNDTETYNKWASKNRFQVGDTLSFIYKKKADSVMEVTGEEYKKCHSDKPISASDDGESVIELNRPGLFYFISGTDEHCENGQKLIVKVLATPPATPAPAQSANVTTEPPTQSANQNTTTEPPPQDQKKTVKNNAVAMHVSGALIFTTIVVSLFEVFFF